MTDARIQEDQVHSLAVVRAILPWREQLRWRFGTEHGNASLELIDVLLVMLAAFFNPLVRSQRLLDALSSQEWMKQRTGVERVPRSTLSDALKRFDPEQLRPLIQQLAQRVPALRRRDADLAEVTRQIVAADGSYFTLAGEVAWAMLHRRSRGAPGHYSQVRLNLQLDIDSMTPLDCDVSGGDDVCEPAAFMRRLRPGVIYAIDRNFVHFAFMNAVLAIGSSFVLRLKKNNVFVPEQELPLSDRDKADGVRSDQVGRLPGPTSKGNQDARSCTDRPPAQPLRRVVIWDQINQQKIILLTDLLDLPAYVIAAIYRHRWQIELFFKWFKCVAGFDHAISQDPRGLTLQFYVAIIATLLLHLITGRRVSKYTLFWLGSVAAGHATFEEMQVGLARIEREKELARARLARKRLAAKNIA